MTYFLFRLICHMNTIAPYPAKTRQPSTLQIIQMCTMCQESKDSSLKISVNKEASVNAPKTCQKLVANAGGWKTGKIPRSDHRSLNISLNKEVNAPKTCQSKVQVAEKWNCVQLPSGRPDQPSRQSGEARSRLQNLRTRRCRYCHGHLQEVIILMTAGTWSCEIMEFVKNGEQDQTNCWLDVEGEVDVIDHGHNGQLDESKTGWILRLRIIAIRWLLSTERNYKFIFFISVKLKCVNLREFYEMLLPSSRETSQSLALDLWPQGGM